MTEQEQFKRSFDIGYEAEFLYGKEFRKRYEKLNKQLDMTLKLFPKNR